MGVNKTDSNKVEPIDVSRVDSILGVVVNPNDSPITVSTSSNHIFVSTSGRYEVLVSDQEGAISTSDYITVSALGGVGMKATPDQNYILGRAAGSFNGKSNVLSSAVLTDSKGKKLTVHISKVVVEIAVGKNPLSRVSNGAPAVLSKAGQAIAGKTVSAIRLYLSAIIFIIGTIVAGSIMYAGVRSSISAIGRNPLSRRSIFRGMIGVSFTSVIVFLVSGFGVYLLLKL